jgi:hypothetical protein
MKNRYLPELRRIVLTAMLIAISAGVWMASGPVRAGELDKLDTSLKLIPANAAFYSSMLRNSEQIEALLNSTAWTKIKSMQSVQKGLAMFEMQAQQPGTPASQFHAAMENPETKKLIDLAGDMGSNEIFSYGGENFNDFAELMQNIMSALRYGPASLQLSGEEQGLNPNELQAKVVLEALVEHLDLLAIPDMTIGFRLKKPAAAKEALIKLETILNLTMEAQPALKGHFKKEQIGDYEYLVLRLDGKMIPWDEVPQDDLKKLIDDENDYQKLIDHIKEMELTIAMGVRENYLIVSIGASVDGVKNLGTGERLIDRSEFAPLEKFVDQKLTGIAYVGKELNERLNNNVKNIDDLHDFLMQMLPLADLTDEQKEQAQKDAEEIADDLKDMLPEAGAIMAFNFLTDKGFEGYRYAWGEHPQLDGAQPLGLLKHVGGKPILGFVGREKKSTEQYDKFVKIVNIGWKYAEELALPKMPDEEREKLKAFVKDATPLLERLDKTNREMLIPALADGQIGLVIDAKLKSKQLQQSLPELENELPIAEPALVFGVSDADLLRKGIAETFAIGNDFVDLIRKYQPDALPPDFKLPVAKMDKQPEGAIYSYPLPEEWGVDKNILPNAGLSDKVAVLSISADHTQRLLKAMPLTIGGVLVGTDQPMAVAGWLDFSDLLDAATPWVNHVLQQMPEEQMGGQKEMVTAEVHTLLDVLHVLKSVTSENTLQDDCLVTHSLLEIHDLGK